MTEDLALVSLSDPVTHAPSDARLLTPLTSLALVVETLPRTLPDTPETLSVRQVPGGEAGVLLGAGGHWLVEADVWVAVPGAAVVLSDGAADLGLGPTEAGPGVAVSTVGLHLLAVGVEEALEGEGSISVVPSEVFTSLSGGTGLLAGLDKDI